MSTHNPTMKFSLSDKFRGINGKVIFWALLVIVLTQLVVSVVYSEQNRQSKNRFNRELLMQQVVLLTQRVVDTPDAQRSKLINSLNLPNIDISTSTNPSYTLKFHSASLWEIHQKLSHLNQDIKMSLLLTPNEWLNISATTSTSASSVKFSLIWFESIITLAILFTLWLINLYTAPMQELMKAANRIGVDLNTAPVKLEGPKIVQNTANALNEMQTRIQDLIRDRTQLLAAISHDLRTPITRMRLRADFIEDKTLYTKTLKDLGEMETMINETLTFFSEDYLREQKSKLDISTLLISICNDFKDIDYPVEFDEVHEQLVVMGISIALKRAINNIINNAIKYGDSARVSLTANSKYIIIRITDRGPGIPDKEIKQVFAPFYRVENSRSRKTGGVGLGLAVSKDIIQAHGGRIELENRKKGGLSVKIRLNRVTD